MTTESNVGLDVGVDLVGYDRGVTAFDDENTLVIIIPDDIAVGETLQPKGAIDVIFQIFHGHLVSEILIIEKR